MRRSFLAWVALATLALQLPAAWGQAAAAPKMAVVPKDKDNDLKLYLADGRVVKGAEAMERMQKDAKLILWLAGNQFFAMDAVVQAFQKQQPGTEVGLITLPPGLLLDAILGGGWVFNGKEYPGLPDVYASVNLGHLKRLKAAGLMDQHAVYMHNELEIMVAKGNPKKIGGIADLGRADVRTSMPNPVNEGIMQFYAKKVLERHGLWQQISGGKECVSCQTTPNNWFTAVHHRETPDLLKAGKTDAGIVWKTETLEALRDGAQVEGVSLPPQDSLRDEVAYAIGALKGSRHADAAARYLAFLASPPGQAAYTAFGFVGASPQELALKPIP
jgi:ABC-type molybdate transport system substrate-binding protein